MWSINYIKQNLKLYALGFTAHTAMPQKKKKSHVTNYSQIS